MVCIKKQCFDSIGSIFFQQKCFVFFEWEKRTEKREMNPELFISLIPHLILRRKSFFPQSNFFQNKETNIYLLISCMKCLFLGFPIFRCKIAILSMGLNLKKVFLQRS